MKILNLVPFNENQKALLNEAVTKRRGVRIVHADPENLDAKMIEEADAILGNPETKLLSHAKKLKWLQLLSAGANQYVSPGVLPEGVILTSCVGAFGLAVSEHLLAMTLSLYKKLNLYRDNQRQSKWQSEGKVKSIVGARVLIVGLGDIGYQYATKIKVLGGYTVAICRSNLSKRDFVDETHPLEELDEELSKADIVALCLPSTDETKNIINKKRLGLMRPEAVLFNVGRGDAIDTKALVEALQEKKIAGAGLDVTDPEPLPQDHALWTFPQVIITPHAAGWFNLEQTQENVAKICLENLEDFLNDKDLLQQKEVRRR